MLATDPAGGSGEGPPLRMAAANASACRAYWSAGGVWMCSIVEASGWWAQLTAKPAKGWQINVGAGSDDPEFGEVDVSDQIDGNMTYYGNVLWTVAPAATVGAEYAMFETEYLDGEKYENSRVQLTLP